MTSPRMPMWRKASKALSMQDAIDCTSLRQGMTTDTSTGVAPGGAKVSAGSISCRLTLVVVVMLHLGRHARSRTQNNSADSLPVVIWGDRFGTWIMTWLGLVLRFR